MTSIEAELLQQQCIYVPWVEKKPIYDIAAPVALHLRSKYNARLTVVCPVKSNAPDALAKFPIVTERTGFVKLAAMAKELDISELQAYALVRRGDLPAIKIGGRGQWRVERSRLEEYIATAYQDTEQSVATNPLSTS